MPVCRQVVEQEWGVDLISSWNKHGWFTMASSIGAKIARLIGAKAHEVMVADSTSVNLFKVVSAALQLRPERRIIVSGLLLRHSVFMPRSLSCCIHNVTSMYLHQHLYRTMGPIWANYGSCSGHKDYATMPCDT